MTIHLCPEHVPERPEFHATKNDPDGAVYVNFKEGKFTDLDEWRDSCLPFEVWAIFIRAFNFQYGTGTTFEKAATVILPNIKYNPKEDLRIVLTANLFRKFVGYGEMEFDKQWFDRDRARCNPPRSLSNSQSIKLPQNSLPPVPPQEVRASFPFVNDSQSLLKNQ